MHTKDKGLGAGGVGKMHCVLQAHTQTYIFKMAANIRLFSELKIKQEDYVKSNPEKESKELSSSFFFLNFRTIVPFHRFFFLNNTIKRPH